MNYPRWTYHKDLAPEGKLIKAQADDPAGDGWVDTPAAFADDYVAPLAADETSASPTSEGVSAYRPKQLYPSYRYNRDGEAKLVANAEADALLNAADWRDSPAAFTAAPESEATTTGAPALRTDGPTLEEYVAAGYKAENYPPEGYAARTASSAPPSAAEGRRAELYAATVTDIAARVETISDRAMLDLILSYEQTNPKGARKGVLQAVNARVAALGPAVPE